MGNIIGSPLIRTPIDKTQFQLVPKPKPVNQRESENPFLRLLLGIFVGVAEVALTIGDVFTGGALVGAQVALAAVDFAGNTALDVAETGSVSLFSSVGSVFTIGGVGVGFQQARQIARAEQAVTESLEAVSRAEELSAAGRFQLLDSGQKASRGEITADGFKLKLTRVGISDTKAIEYLKNTADQLKALGIKNQRFFQEVDFATQESGIFKTLGKDLEKVGVDINDVFTKLKSVGIDVEGIQTTKQIAREIKTSPEAYSILKDAELARSIENAISRDIEPTLFSRMLNQQKLERAFSNVNKTLSVANPSTAITKVTDKLLDPLKSKLEEKVYSKLEKNFRQKIQGLIRKDIERKAHTKNGVYPAFSSRAINYIRAIALGGGEYKAAVVWRKQGYQQTYITPALTLEFIINWSESSSPGRIYHKFRKQYGLPRGTLQAVQQDGGISPWGFFQVLGFIPDKYIAYGVSLIANINNVKNVIQQDQWANFASEEKNFIDPFKYKFLDIAGGQFGTAIYNQASGGAGSVNQYFQGKLNEVVDSKRGEVAEQRWSADSKVSAVQSLKNII